MANAAFAEVVVFDEVLYKPGGQVNRWMTLLCNHFEMHAKEAAPERSGELKAGITSRATPYGFKQMRGLIASNAPYSLYVLRGTGFPTPPGTIYSRKVWLAGGDSDVAYVELWGYVDPITRKFSRKAKKGTRREKVRFGKRGYWMRFGPDDHGPKVIAWSVNGQEPNNYLFAAWRATARTHPSIRGLAPNASILDFPMGHLEVWPD